MRFVKMHGAGNDYVYVDLFDQEIGEPVPLARAVSDRRTGVGSDGLILLGPSEVADVRMIMFNADGSRAQMCGNGIRCLAVLARDNGRVQNNPMRIETDAGVKSAEIVAGGVRVDMGAPQLAPASLPVLLPGDRIVNHEIEVDGVSLAMTCVSMGNPHAVLYVDDVASFDVAHVGPALETSELFPERVNVSFVEVVDRTTVRQRTWERGSGETHACGTGACAVCVAGVLTGRTDASMTSIVLGGQLRLEWDGHGPVYKTGPAVTVFEGEWNDHGM